MVFPGDLTDALISHLQSIAELTALLGNDPKRIFTYKRRHPDTTNLMEAIYKQPIPSIMVVWEGITPNPLRGVGELATQRYGLYVRTKDEVNGDASMMAYRVWKAFVDGVPLLSPQGMKMRLTCIHDSCYFMEPPSILPQSGQTSESQGPFEFFKISTGYTEKGDY